MQSPKVFYAGRCVKCGKCKSVCPTYRLERNELLSPRGRVHIVERIESGEIEALETAHPVESCLLCMACEEKCPQNVSITEAVKRARQRLKSPAKTFEKAGVYLSPKAHSYKDYPTSSYKECAVFAGCVITHVYPDLLDSLGMFLNKFGYSVYVPGEQVCCGYPFEASGDESKARECRELNEKVFARYEIIITACATCASHLKRIYPEKRIADIMELVAEDIDILEINQEFQSLKVAYHTPCHLLRGQKIRPVLPEGIVTLSYSCCGFGALNSKVATERIREAIAKNAQYLVTSCPACMLQLQSISLQLKASLKILHILEIFDV
ncbi:glycolate oxidase iron-sulfur subunit [Thermosulfidibacter takaii ABI70S6]|uniref:Glycolate oxidase iron-sulfur subunit n=1 Tax=Thermosulfidibacter takaii (strain DSM 17441 / JCM 13301 / NBRC 103674 / ABI70S6) TaxID=1298851 RepID=A0A0S3QVB8_THET7|nr:(Fe-S)-binding protein [Thermosulfidibacter takaii]BAT72255.1 glycolate oxidase iron-sulfur subunit [Thermosulfidibacter takaii ABI70S6]